MYFFVVDPLLRMFCDAAVYILLVVRTSCLYRVHWSGLSPSFVISWWSTISPPLSHLAYTLYAYLYLTINDLPICSINSALLFARKKYGNFSFNKFPVGFFLNFYVDPLVGLRVIYLSINSLVACKKIY